MMLAIFIFVLVLGGLFFGLGVSDTYGKKGVIAVVIGTILLISFSCVVYAVQGETIFHSENCTCEKCNQKEKKTETYTMGGYAVNSVTIETDDWNVWRVHGYEMIEDEYYIVTFDDNGTMNVEDDIILNIEKANPPKN